MYSSACTQRVLVTSVTRRVNIQTEVEREATIFSIANQVAERCWHERLTWISDIEGETIKLSCCQLLKIKTRLGIQTPIAMASSMFCCACACVTVPNM